MKNYTSLLSKRLFLLRAALGYGNNIENFIKKIGINRRTYYRYENESSTSSIRLEDVNKIHECFSNINISWLITGKGNILNSSTVKTLIPINVYNNDYLSNEVPKTIEYEKKLLVDFFGIRNFKELDFIKNCTDSMIPFVFTEEMVIIEKSEPTAADLVLVKSERYKHPLIGQYSFIEKESIIKITFSNEKYEEIKIKEKDKAKYIYGVVKVYKS